jgi:Tat protein translocase TatC
VPKRKKPFASLALGGGILFGYRFILPATINFCLTGAGTPGGTATPSDNHRRRNHRLHIYSLLFRPANCPNPILACRQISFGIGLFQPGRSFCYPGELALIASVILVNPLIFYQIGAFILPGLTKAEKDGLAQILVRIIPLFSGGVFFGYWIITPIISDLLITFGQSYMTSVLSRDKYLSFVALFTVINGLLFIMPVIIVQLGKMGLLDFAKLKKGRKYLLVSPVVLETLIGSLNDPLSLLALTLPLVILYEATIWWVRWRERKKRTAVLYKMEKQSGNRPLS